MQRLRALVFLGLLLPGRLSAADLFADDFNRSDGPLDATLEDDWLTTLGTADIASGEALLQTSPGVSEGWTWIDSVSFADDVLIQFDIRFDNPDDTSVVARHGGVMFFATDKSDRYNPLNSGYTIDWIDRATDQGYRLHKWTNGVESILLPDRSAPDPDPGLTWQILVSGSTITLTVDGVVKFSFDDMEYREGSIGFWGWSNGQHIHIDNFRVPRPPTARLAAVPDTGPVPLNVAFDGSASTTPEGAITGYAWDFGDGQSGSGVQVNHPYPSTGIYRARLTVTDSRGIAGVASTTIKALFASGDVSPWSSSDVGTPVMPGGARFEGECLSLFAGGKGIGSTADHFHLVHLQKSGDVTLTTRVERVVSLGTTGRGGAMLRDSLDPDSAFALMGVQPIAAGLRPVFIRRSARGLTTASRSLAALTLVPPAAYLRLERQGAEIIGSASPDGLAWSEVSRVTFTAPVAAMLAGLALSAGDTKEVGAAANLLFCGTGFEPIEPPPNAFHRGDADDSGSIQITDAIRVLSFLFSGGTEPECLEAADVDDSGGLQITDAVRLLGFLFQGGPPPESPGPPAQPCGPDRPGSPTDLGCATYTHC